MSTKDHLPECMHLHYHPNSYIRTLIRQKISPPFLFSSGTQDTFFFLPLTLWRIRGSTVDGLCLHVKKGHFWALWGISHTGPWVHYWVLIERQKKRKVSKISREMSFSFNVKPYLLLSLPSTPPPPPPPKARVNKLSDLYGRQKTKAGQDFLPL